MFGSHHDCSMFACSCIQAITGIDVGALFRDRYRSEKGAFLVCKRFGGAGLEAAVEKVTADNRWEEVPPLMAQRGDVILIRGSQASSTGETDVLGIVDLNGIEVVYTDEAIPIGLNRIRIDKSMRAWRIE